MLITVQYIGGNSIFTLQNCLSDGMCSLATCSVGTFMFQSFISIDISYAVDANLYNVINVSTCFDKKLLQNLRFALKHLLFTILSSAWFNFFPASFMLTQKAFGDLLKKKLSTFLCFFLSKLNSHKFIVVKHIHLI